MADSSASPVRLPDDAIRLVETDPGIDRAELARSRACGTALPLSDFNFKITTGAFAQGVRYRLPVIAARLRPVVAQWDRLSFTWCYMLILAGSVNVDLIFIQPARLAGHRGHPAGDAPRDCPGGAQSSDSVACAANSTQGLVGTDSPGGHCQRQQPVDPPWLQGCQDGRVGSTAGCCLASPPGTPTATRHWQARGLVSVPWPRQRLGRMDGRSDPHERRPSCVPL